MLGTPAAFRAPELAVGLTVSWEVMSRLLVVASSNSEQGEHVLGLQRHIPSGFG